MAGFAREAPPSRLERVRVEERRERSGGIGRQDLDSRLRGRRKPAKGVAALSYGIETPQAIPRFPDTPNC